MKFWIGKIKQYLGFWRKKTRKGNRVLVFCRYDKRPEQGYLQNEESVWVCDIREIRAHCGQEAWQQAGMAARDRS